MACFSVCAIVPSVAVQVRCRVVVPATVTVIGVSGLRPAETSSPAAAATESSVVDTTTVPSDAPTSVQHRSGRRPRVHEPHVRALRVPQRHTGVRGHTDGARDTGDDLEGHPGGGARQHLLGGVRVEARVTGHRTHDPPAAPRGLHDKMCGIPHRGDGRGG